MKFYERIRAAQRSRNSLLCVGLDTDPLKLPPAFRHSHDGILEFNRRVIDATSDAVCAYKINLAFYEALGEAGWSIIQQTIRHVPADILVIGDAKRGDIGNTAMMYATSLLDQLQFQAVTVNPYMGKDSVEPFIRDEHTGAFILSLTSNPGARDMQYLSVGKSGIPLYEHVIRLVKKWNVRRNCGLVVGATRPHQLKMVRAITPDMPLLIPGVGAQGGDLASAVRYGSDRSGEMAIINASRSILYASSGRDFAGAARTAACELRDAINRVREKYF
ncbi:MAG: orotidine-5'-phosphate decarboxylase [Ignavibacteria bacterium]|nr:orotidine-5'-phosphate decarboxylase [Ignavibacteria bacterium]